MFKLFSIKKLSETELIKKFKESGDNKIIGELYTRHTAFVFSVCLKYLKNEDRAREACLEIFERLIDELKKHEVDNFKAWLHIVTKNFCLMQLRKEKNNQKHFANLSFNSENIMEKSDLNHHNNEEDKEFILNKLEEGIDNLKDEQKTCIKLFYLDEKCYNEVAEITGYSLKNVKSYIQNGKRNLGNYLNKFNEE